SCAWRLLFYFFFFFQAEDGIRDFHVTGVQTCALPIFAGLVFAVRVVARLVWLYGRWLRIALRVLVMLVFQLGFAFGFAAVGARRSEERRVGKEGRSGGSPYDEDRKGDAEETSSGESSK